jgi:hypothetical protein
MCTDISEMMTRIGELKQESLLHDLWDMKLCFCGEKSLYCRGALEPIHVISA